MGEAVRLADYHVYVKLVSVIAQIRIIGTKRRVICTRISFEILKTPDSFVTIGREFPRSEPAANPQSTDRSAIISIRMIAEKAGRISLKQISHLITEQRIDLDITPKIHATAGQ